MVVQGCSKLSSNVSTYFTSLNKIWQELDLADDCNWSYATDCERYRAQINKERINDFLAGLNKELDEVHGQLLGIKPLPVIEEIFVKVRREETHKRVMLGRVKTPTVLGNTTTDNSALAAHKNDSSHGDTHNNRRNDNLWCDHYQKSNHSCENCWKLNGRPPNFKDN
ncbi:hypothetical protein CK203_021842 [Vitis vinifera]|uniref:Retrotransposon gag domain-containing protein n=1 Tax=Vitis vinifera TaxID=29760 RepID=A0A438JFJ8_VITVI|nr:hypothetical protein CK203_021842 [Vitis vinifera]